MISNTLSTVHVVAQEAAPPSSIAALPVSARSLARVGRGDEPYVGELAFQGSPHELRLAARLGGYLPLASDAVGSRERILFGVGERISPESLRLGAIALGRRLPPGRETRIGFDLTGVAASDRAQHAAALTEGVILGAYRWQMPWQRAAALPEVVICVGDGLQDEVQERCRRAAVAAAAANWARQLTDTPPSDLTPADLAEAAIDLAQADGCRATILDADALQAGGFGAILSVGRGSSRPPCLIELEYHGRDEGPPDMVLVGKGVTMDCGGLNVKSRHAETAEMKCDMAGAAAVLAAVAAACELKLKVNLRALVPAVENLPGPDALRPGDVITHLGGRRSEVSLTDAEGRLILADCLIHGRRDSEHALLIDVATLSDAPFGPSGWCVIARSRQLGERLVRAAEATGELAVHAGLIDGYETLIESSVADARNYSYAHARQDLMIAAAFLEPFAGANPWAHIDNSDSAYLLEPWLTWPRGATGSPTRSLVEFVEGWVVPGS
jgi:leucyl aminopeptidase